MKFAHTMIRVFDLDKSIDFYENALGFTLSRKSNYEDGKFSLAFLDIPNSDVQLELTYNWPQDEPYDLGSGYGHIALFVDSMEKIVEQIRSAGYELDRGPKTSPAGDKQMAFVKDPDGYAIELLEISGS